MARTSCAHAYTLVCLCVDGVCAHASTCVHEMLAKIRLLKSTCPALVRVC